MTLSPSKPVVLLFLSGERTKNNSDSKPLLLLGWGKHDRGCWSDSVRYRYDSRPDGTLSKADLFAFYNGEDVKREFEALKLDG